MRYLIKFDENGFRQETYVCDEKTEQEAQALLDGGFVVVSEEDYQLLIGNVDGNVYIRDPKTGEYKLYVSSAEELAEQALAQAKAERAAEVERLTVEVEGMVFDADETSQARMSVAASSMTDDETNVWVLHDNSVVQVTKAQLLLACRLARIAQSAVWTKPYEAS